MEFQLECDDSDALVLIDPGYFSDLDDDLLYSMDILLDPLGRSELIFDYPGEDWKTVWERETKPVLELSGAGKLFIKQFSEQQEKMGFEFVHGEDEEELAGRLHIPTGKLVAVSASELIQCLAYPGLEMETIFEMELPAGWYAVAWQDPGKIIYREITAENGM